MTAQTIRPKSKTTKIGSYKIALEPKPLSEVKKAIGKGLTAFNMAATGPYNESEYLVSVRDAKGHVRGGFVVDVYYDTAFLRWAWVDEKLRGKAMGRTLMAAAENEARERGAKVMWLDTFSFQARPFYEKLGYAVFGTLTMGRPELERYFLSKKL